MGSRDDMEERIDAFIRQQREIGPNPFLSTRVMAAIDTPRVLQSCMLSPVLRMMLIGGSLTLAVFAGYNAGNMYRPSADNAEESVLVMNDERMEHFLFYKQSGEKEE